MSVERPLNSTSQAATMVVETDDAQRFCFGIWLESAELVCERLKIAYESAKSAKKKVQFRSRKKKEERDMDACIFSLTHSRIYDSQSMSRPSLT